jgi:hypothetical protein
LLFSLLFSPFSSTLALIFHAGAIRAARALSLRFLPAAIFLLPLPFPSSLFLPLIFTFHSTSFIFFLFSYVILAHLFDIAHFARDGLYLHGGRKMVRGEPRGVVAGVVRAGDGWVEGVLCWARRGNVMSGTGDGGSLGDARRAGDACARRCRLSFASWTHPSRFIHL